ncbi:LAMI_0D12200g1_1 [Lachancea mirantina]|uniref:proline--tRNA ligase n=1 Tax=Lachancea mirantina TaxID=1230905 RepID=A0A1G4JFJ0_9SACH|nr:LAMI_0D12200g1_1 [Lachancea mirantina]
MSSSKSGRIIRRIGAFHAKNLTKDAYKTLPTHELLQALGFVKQSQSGLVHWLPLGLKSLNKISEVIKKHMDQDLGASEVSLSTLSARKLWEKTGRWGNTELFKLKDAKKADYCLNPTCEEEITALVGGYVSSYKDLPLIAYQITRKYRDERRPRGGLLRGREFLMKDAYSFDASKADAVATFDRVNKCYDGIFQDLGVPFVSAWADSGDIGGDMSKEYHYEHESGEDTVLKCDNCGSISNVEKCSSVPVEEGLHSGNADVKYALNACGDTLICLYYPEGRTLNWNLVKEALQEDVDVSMRDSDNLTILDKFKSTLSEDSELFASVVRVMDVRLNSRSNFPDFPLKQYMKSNFAQLGGVSLVDAIAGEICGSCQEGNLSEARTIEVGHSFYLGQKYSKVMKAKYMNKDNKDDFLEMGCYGIGVSRLVAAIGQVTRDKQGLRWPRAASPFEVTVCVPAPDERGTEVAEQLCNSSIDVWIDEDARTGLGRKVLQSHATGIPLCVAVGSKQWPFVDVEVRGERRANSWEQRYAQASRDEWTLTDQTDAGIEKHRVHKDRVAEVVTVLLADM